MPKTRYFSNPEKTQAMDRLKFHHDINAPHLLTSIIQPTHRRWRKNLPRRQNATLSEKSFPLSDKRTMSAKFITNKQLYNNPNLTPDPSIQPPA